MSKEQVLVFPASELSEYAADFSGSPILAAPEMAGVIVQRLLTGAFYMDREKAETDPTYKQLIPYCLLQDNGKTLAYQRTKKGGESRLHDKWSVGVGGHINPCDGVTGYYSAGVRRELLEEAGLELNGPLWQHAPIYAVINDNSNEVGKVHFGVVHVVPVDSSALTFADPALANGTWMGREMLGDLLREGRFESWSELVVRHVLGVK